MSESWARVALFAVLFVGQSCALGKEANLRLKLPPFPRLLPLSRGRNLKAATRPNAQTLPEDLGTERSGGQCRWDAARQRCAVGEKAVVELFESSSNDYAHLVAKYVNCAAASKQATCSATAGCVWNPREEDCLFVDFLRGREDSPCARRALGTLRGFVASDKCALHLTQTECMMDPLCVGEGVDGKFRCDADAFFFYVNRTVADIMGGADLIYGHKVLELLAEFPQYFDLDDPGFEWKAVLDWKVPQTSCPDWADPVVCAYADGIVSTLSQSFYCGGNYPRPGHSCDCLKDPLCVVDPGDGTCRQTDAAYTPGFLQGLQNTVPFFQHSGDREIINKVLQCAGITDKELCSGACVWSVSEEGCELEGISIADIIASPGVKEDAVCQMAEAQSAAGCVDIDDAETCSSNPDCRVMLSGDCWASTEYLVSAVLEQDRLLAEAFGDMEAHCTALTTEAQCTHDALSST